MAYEMVIHSDEEGELRVVTSTAREMCPGSNSLAVQGFQHAELQCLHSFARRFPQKLGSGVHAYGTQEKRKDGQYYAPFAVLNDEGKPEIRWCRVETAYEWPEGTQFLLDMRIKGNRKARLETVEEAQAVRAVIGEQNFLAVCRTIADNVAVWVFLSPAEVDENSDLTSEEKEACKLRFNETGGAYAGWYRPRPRVPMPGYDVVLGC